MSAPSAARQRVDLARDLPLPLDGIRAVVERDFAGLMARLGPSSRVGLVPLEVQLSGRLRLEREVNFGFGRLIEEDDGTVTLPLWWEAADHPRLFPTFDGGLELSAIAGGTEVRLVGSYTVPLGFLGAFADGLTGHRAARSSLEGLLDGIAAAVADRVTASRA